MIYLNVSKGDLPGHQDFSVDVDNTTVRFGLVQNDVLKEILEDLLENVKAELNLL